MIPLIMSLMALCGLALIMLSEIMVVSAVALFDMLGMRLNMIIKDVMLLSETICLRLKGMTLVVKEMSMLLVSINLTEPGYIIYAVEVVLLLPGTHLALSGFPMAVIRVTLVLVLMYLSMPGLPCSLIQGPVVLAGLQLALPALRFLPLVIMMCIMDLDKWTCQKRSWVGCRMCSQPLRC